MNPPIKEAKEAKAGRKTIKIASSGGIPVEKWSEDMIPKACQD